MPNKITFLQLVSIVNKLSERLDAIEKKLNEPVVANALSGETEWRKSILNFAASDSSVTIPDIIPNSPAIIAPQEIVFPVPVELRMVVDEVLSKHFGVRVVPRTDSPQFDFIIVVPEKYSNISAEYKKVYGEDLRPKTLSPAEGVNGARMWAERVYKNFSAEVQAQIVADRFNATV